MDGIGVLNCFFVNGVFSDPFLRVLPINISLDRLSPQFWGERFEPFSNSTFEPLEIAFVRVPEPYSPSFQLTSLLTRVEYNYMLRPFEPPRPRHGQTLQLVGIDGIHA